MAASWVYSGKATGSPNLFAVIKLCLLLFTTCLASSAQAQAPGLLWATNMGTRIFAVDAQTNVYSALTNGSMVILNHTGVPQQTNSICPLPAGTVQRDEPGNFYFGGSFDGTQNFGGITLVGGFINQGRWASGWPSCFLAKYRSDSSLEWVVAFGVAGERNYVKSLAVNADGSVTVAWYAQASGGRISLFNNAGTKLWEKEALCSLLGDYPGFSVSRFEGGVARCVQYNQGSIAGKFFDVAGNLTYFPTPLPFPFFDTLSANGQPAYSSSNDLYLAGMNLSPRETILVKTAAGGGVIWTKSLGAVEQWVLANDRQANLFLAGTDGIFSMYNSDGVLVWSTNYGNPAVAMLLDTRGNRFLSFADGSIARLTATDSITQPTLRPDSLAGAPFEGFRFTIIGAPNSVYDVLRSTNCAGWENVGTVTNVSGEVQYLDPLPAKAKFYKAVTRP